MALYIKIGGLRRNAHGYEFLLQREPRLLGLGVAVLERAHAVAHLAAQVVEHGLGVENGEVAEFRHAVEIANGELAVDAAPVMPDGPHEEGEERLAEPRHEVLEIEDAVVVERHHNAHVVERGGETLVVLNGVDVGVEHVGVGDDSLRRGRGPVDEPVVVGIHTGYHAAAHTVGKEVHQHRFLAALQRVARGEHHLEIAFVVLEPPQDGAPEEHVVVALHISHDAPPGFLGV